MLFRLDHRSGVPIYRQVEEQVRRGILSGALADGEKLPAVRELSDGLRVNPMTISKAYSRLELEGWVERRRGVGVFVRSRPAAKEEEERRRVLGEALRKAAFCAVQLGVSLADSSAMFARHYRDLSSGEEQDK